MSDRSELLARAKGGDRKAIDQLPLAYDTELRGFCRKFAWKHKIEEEDLLQETRLAFPEIAKRYNVANGASFSTYLHDQVRGIATKYAREQPRSMFSVYELEVERRPDPRKPRYPIGHRIADWWPNAAIRYVEGLRRANDRAIADSLWLAYPPSTEAEIARKIGVSRQAVAERRKSIAAELTKRFGTLYLGEKKIGPELHSATQTSDESNDEWDEIERAREESDLQQWDMGGGEEE